MAIVCLLMLLQTGVGVSFLLANSSHTGLTSFEFQHLSQLIINEEHSRHHVENEVDNMEYRMTKLEEDMKNKYEQQLKNFTNTIDQIKNTSASLDQRLEAKYEKQLKNVTDAIDEMKNSSVSLAHRLEQQIKRSAYMRHLFEKEKTNRLQLEHEYSDMEQKYQNLLLSYDDLINKTDHLDTVLNDDEKGIARNTASIKSNSVKLAMLNGILTTLKRSVSTSNATIAELKQKTGLESAFFVYNPNAQLSGRIKFWTETMNLGGDFNMTSGTFTCSLAGTYPFILNLYKAKGVTSARCELRKNGQLTIWLDARPPTGAADNYQEATNSVIAHMSKGDEVYITCDTPVTNLDPMTSFMGFLLYPD